MWEEAKAMVEENSTYFALGVLAIVGLGLLWRWLNKPGKQESEHEKRFQRLKEHSKEKYRHMRPLK
ncbi:MAG: hypothetical protein WHX93_15375 [bacterium]